MDDAPPLAPEAIEREDQVLEGHKQPLPKALRCERGGRINDQGDASEAVLFARSYRNLTRKHYGVKVKSGSVVRGCEASFSYVVSGLEEMASVQVEGCGA